MPVLWWKGVVQVSLPMLGLCFIGVSWGFIFLAVQSPLYILFITEKSPQENHHWSSEKALSNSTPTSQAHQVAWIDCSAFTVFPHLLPIIKVLPTQSAAQYKQLLFLVLVGPSLGYVHKKMFLF